MPDTCKYVRSGGEWTRTEDCPEGKTCPRLANSKMAAEDPFKPEREPECLESFRDAMNNGAFEFAANDTIELECEGGSERLEYRGSTSADFEVLSWDDGVPALQPI